MSRVVCLGLILGMMLGCALPGEHTALRPLPENSPPLPYAELLTRLRAQGEAAIEAFYIDKWGDLEEVSNTLEQTARFLARASDVPVKHKDTLPVISNDLGKEAVNLREAAKTHDVDKVNEILRRINLKIRELRLDG